MNHNTNTYNYELLPQWQLLSKAKDCVSIETQFLELVNSLYQQKIRTLLCGSGNELKPTYDELNTLHQQLRNDNDSFWRSPPLDEWLDMADFMKPVHEKDLSPLFWKVYLLASKPHESLSSWLHAFNVADSDADKSLADFYAFHQSTLYLLSTCIPGTERQPYFNPLVIEQHLYHAFVQTSRAYCALKKAYPPIYASYYNNGLPAAKETLVVYDPYLFEDSDWYFINDADSDDIKNQLFQLFKSHFEKNDLPFNENVLTPLVAELTNIVKQNAKACYLFPFICTKLFVKCINLNVNLDKKSSQKCNPNIHDLLCDELYSYEPLPRLSAQHHRKIHADPIFFADEKSHPIIAFMQDAVCLAFKYGTFKAQKSKTEVMTQINTNWLALSLYGSGRFFSDPQICFHYCDLTLPILLKQLYSGGDGGLKLYTEWLLSLAGVSNVEFKLNITTTALDDAFIKAIEDIEQQHASDKWKDQLASYAFNSQFWEDSKLVVPSPDALGIAQKINVFMGDVVTILKKKGESPKNLSAIVRIACIRYLFKPIVAALYEYLSMLSRPDEQKCIFDIDTIHRKPTELSNS